MAKIAEQVTAQVIRTLYDAGAQKWTIQEKGTLLAAIKLQLSEEVRNGQKATAPQA